MTSAALAWLGGALLLLGARGAAAADNLDGVPMLTRFDVGPLAEAIARAEGFYAVGPTIPKAAHNPGNLKRGDVGFGTTAGGITIFASDADGWTALRRQLLLIFEGRSRYYQPTMTLAEMARTWTATEQSAWAANVARGLGVPVSTRLQDVV